MNDSKMSGFSNYRGAKSFRKTMRSVTMNSIMLSTRNNKLITQADFKRKAMDNSIDKLSDIEMLSGKGHSFVGSGSFGASKRDLGLS